MQQIGEAAFELTGDLTIRGVTKPVTVAFEWTGAEHDPQGNVRIHVKGSTTINRKDWGVHWAATTGLVGKEVALESDVTVIRQT